MQSTGVPAKSYDHWWKKVFNKTYLSAFDYFYSHEKTKQEVDFIVKTAKLKPSASVLDLFCGQGRHSIELAKRGYIVTGVDYSADLLYAARVRAKKADVRPIFLKKDIRSLRLSKKFDVVCILGNSFGYFDDAENEAIISVVSKLLKDDGIFILDLANTLARPHTKSERRDSIPGGYILSEEESFDPVSQRSFMKWTIVKNKKKSIFHGVLKFYTHSAIKRLLVKHGLRPIKTFGSFAGDAHVSTSPRMIAVVGH